MTQKFKVGDKVKPVTDGYSITSKSRGWEGVVTEVSGLQFTAKTTKGRPAVIGKEYRCLKVEHFELVDAKLTKKKRIEKLEERVDALCMIIESLRKALD